MMKTNGIIYLLNQMESPELGVFPERCVAVRNRNADCLKCAEVCTSEAIRIEDDALVVSPEKCIGCGTCATACPTCALEAQNPTDKKLSDEAAAKLAAHGDGVLVIGCDRAMYHAYKREEENKRQAKGRFGFGKTQALQLDESRIVRVACLGRIDESFLLEMAARGAKRIIMANHNCETCVHRNGGRLNVEVCSSATNLVRAFASEMRIERVVDLPDDAFTLQEVNRGIAYDETRRGFFSGIGKTAQGTVDATLSKEELVLEREKPAERYEKVQDDGTLRHHVPMRRLRLYNSMRFLGEPCFDELDTRLWGRVSIDVDACSSCRMCAVFCPTGAISKTDDVSSGVGLRHQPSKCVQCRVCESICPSNAINVFRHVSFEEFQTGSTTIIELHALDWEPNKPDSMYRKSAGIVGGVNAKNVRCF
ncbi:MAG: 4Fe-4S binding protein [Eggerthellaceae bacterium]|nr:4Fe-4S binding protein [Eggerthellaceae bacterium]